MNAWPIGLSTGCFFRQGIFSVIDELCRSGFKLVEVCSFPQHLDYHREDQVRLAGERIRSCGIRAYSFHAPFADWIDITALDKPSRTAAVQELMTACRAAAMLGAEHVVLHPGPEREGRPPAAEFLQRMHHAAESLNAVADLCSALGVKLLLENMLPHLLFGRASDMLYLLGEIREPTVGACLDTGHANLSGDLPGIIHKLSGHLKMAHVNDNCGDRDSHLIPGEGLIDWRQVMSALREQHFHGGLIIEMAAQPGEPVEHTLSRAVRAREFLGNLAG